MRRNPAREIPPLDIFFHNFPHSPCGDSSSAMIQEQLVRVRAHPPDFIHPDIKIHFQSLDTMATHRQKTLLSAFSQHFDHAGIKVDVLQSQRNQFTDTQSTAVKQLQQSPIADGQEPLTLRQFQKAEHFINGKICRKFVLCSGCGNSFGNIGF